MKANITVTLKPGVLDPQGQAVGQAMESLDGRAVDNVRVGKFIEIDIEENDETRAREFLDKMCRKLLANPVTENYHIELLKD